MLLRVLFVAYRQARSVVLHAQIRARRDDTLSVTIAAESVEQSVDTVSSAFRGVAIAHLPLVQPRIDQRVEDCVAVLRLAAQASS